MTPDLAKTDVLPLVDGDRLTRDEFERRYTAMPHVNKAELIEGVVYMPSPVHQRRHSRPHHRLVGWTAAYEARTPGVEGGDNGTVRLDVINEPQPDAMLFILPECGGQSRLSKDDYIEQAPELVVEVSGSSKATDLGPKFNVYLRCGVREYIVWRVDDGEIDWFILRDEKYDRLAPGTDGLWRSEVYPGLWLDGKALLAGDLVRVHDVLAQGMSTPEHAAFVQRLKDGRGGI